jgi:hypothetical protein
VIIYSDSSCFQTVLQSGITKLFWKTTRPTCWLTSRTALHARWCSHIFQSCCLRYTNREFPDRRRCRGGPTASFPRSSDLNSMDFYMWGHLKSFVYTPPMDDVETRRNRIVTGVRTISIMPGIGIFGWQRDFKLRPTFRQEVAIWNIYCNEIRRAECRRQILKNWKVGHSELISLSKHREFLP